MKQAMCLGMRLVRVNVDQRQVFVMIDSIGIMINANVNVNNWLIMVGVIMVFLEVLARVNMNVINHVMFKNT